MPMIRLKPVASLVLSAALAAILTTPSRAEDKPIKALLVTGGCCHDYEQQKDIIKQGVEARANVQIDILYVKDGSTQPKLPIYGNPEYAKGYAVVIHDECSADIKDPELIQDVLRPHQAGIPGVNLHCAMHCYRFGDFGKPVPAGSPNSHWYEYLGLHSSGHGAQKPIAIKFLDKENWITKDMADWTTIDEELYNNVEVADDTTRLATGSQGSDAKTPVVAWYHLYGEKKTRVFSTTIGHNNETVSDPRYLDLVTRGLLWAVNRPDALKK
jgi:hypothetical protein